MAFYSGGTIAARSYIQNGVVVTADGSGKHTASIARGFGYGNYPACEVKRSFWRPIRFHMPSAYKYVITIIGEHRGMSGSESYWEEYQIEGANHGDQIGYKIYNRGGSTLMGVLDSSKSLNMPGTGSYAYHVLQQIGSGYNNVDLCFAVTPSCGSSKSYTFTIDWWGDDGDISMLNYNSDGPNYDASLSNGPNIIGATD